MFEPSCLSGHSNVMTTAPVRNSGKIVHIGGAEPSVTQALIGEDDGTIGTRKVVFWYRCPCRIATVNGWMTIFWNEFWLVIGLVSLEQMIHCEAPLSLSWDHRNDVEIIHHCNGFDRFTFDLICHETFFLFVSNRMESGIWDGLLLCRREWLVTLLQNALRAVLDIFTMRRATLSESPLHTPYGRFSVRPMNLVLKALATPSCSVLSIW